MVIRRIERPITNVTTPIACKKVKGRWDAKHGVCIKYTDNKTYGILAPIRGIVFGYWSTDLSKVVDDWDEDYFNGRKYAPEVVGGPIDGFLEIPEQEYFEFDGSIFHNNEIFQDSEEVYEKRKDAYDSAKELAMEVVSDVKRGKARDWSMDYYDKKGKPICIGPGCATINRMMDDPFKKSPYYSEPGFRFRRKP